MEGALTTATAINTRAATGTVTTTVWEVLVMMEASSVHRLRIRMTYYSPSAGLVEPSTAALVVLGAGAVAGVRVVLSWPPAVRTCTESAGGACEDLRCTAGLVWSDAEFSAACTRKVP